MKRMFTILLSFSLVTPLGAQAAFFSPPLPTQLALLNEAIQSLLDLKSGLEQNINTSEDAEILLRKKILLQIIDLSEQDIKDIERNLETIDRADIGKRMIRQSFSDELGGIGQQYTILTNEITETTSLDDVKEGSKKVLAERYAAEKLATDIALIATAFENRDSTEVAKARLNKIAFDVRKLEIFGVVEIGSLNGLLVSAAGHIAAAKQTQDMLEDTIIQTFTVKSGGISELEETTASEETNQESLLSSPGVQIGEGSIFIVNPLQNTAPQKPQLDIEKTQTLLAQSLAEIKAAYLIFIDIGKQTQAALR